MHERLLLSTARLSTKRFTRDDQTKHFHAMRLRLIRHLFEVLLLKILVTTSSKLERSLKAWKTLSVLRPIDFRACIVRMKIGS